MVGNTLQAAAFIRHLGYHAYFQAGCTSNSLCQSLRLHLPESSDQHAADSLHGRPMLNYELMFMLPHALIVIELEVQ